MAGKTSQVQNWTDENNMYTAKKLKFTHAINIYTIQFFISYKYLLQSCPLELY